MIYVLCLIILILLILLARKHKSEAPLRESCESLERQELQLQYEIECHINELDKLRGQIEEAQSHYQTEIEKRGEDLNDYFEAQRKARQEEMDAQFTQLIDARKETLARALEEIEQQYQSEIEKVKYNVSVETERLKAAQQELIAETQFQEKRFDALIDPIRQYEKERQERLFYTIQVPDEYKDDIKFLLSEVTSKVRHPDIINKLIWAEYVKPYIDDTFRRVGVKDEPGIYKLTSLVNGKCYIGKSTNMKKRISDHMKGVVGINAIADQEVHHVIAKEGYWNWTIEPVIYCEKSQLSDLEKYYINFFKSNIYGLNKSKGGEG